ncbi:hypothetical protein TIFTF001_010334 [Ficus carica]|uniref:Uncharacterized protein n=1 Tax=Ficus carica TaxID=3494 RepID=A0AA88AC33_FICCA|nr:hypothetical protein TIFTF001_010334 [Ficus carica]
MSSHRSCGPCTMLSILKYLENDTTTGKTTTGFNSWQRLCAVTIFDACYKPLPLQLQLPSSFSGGSLLPRSGGEGVVRCRGRERRARRCWGGWVVGRIGNGTVKTSNQPWGWEGRGSLSLGGDLGCGEDWQRNSEDGGGQSFNG